MGQGTSVEFLFCSVAKGTHFSCVFRSWGIIEGGYSGLHGPTIDFDKYSHNPMLTESWANVPQGPKDMVLVLGHYLVTEQGMDNSISLMRSYSQRSQFPSGDAESNILSMHLTCCC